MAGEQGSLSGNPLERASSGFEAQTTTSRSGFSKGAAFSRTAFTTLNMAVLAPIPRARVSTATAANIGRFKRTRRARPKSGMRDTSS